jgi:predicted MFS family arabinose efflux permease
VVLLAVACGATVANLYYTQPILPSIARAFRVSDGEVGLLVTVTQLCYAAGLILIVPLGDVVDRVKLTVWLLAACSTGLVLAALAPTIGVLAGALGIVAITSVVVQILTPFASTLASEARRGRVVGMVVSGTLSGILLARTVSGILASAAGWRAVFVMSALLMGLLLVALARSLPHVPARTPVPYRELLRSTARLVVAEPALRRRMVYGACGMASFTLVWTALAFLLAGAPYHYHAQTIGLFGLAGLAGALGAQGFGRLSDAGWGRPATGAVLAVVVLSWGVLAMAATSLVALAVGLCLLDLGAQGQNVLSQGVIYSLGAHNAGRVTTAYVTANFTGGTIGSIAASVAWTTDGWTGVCSCGAAIAALAVGFWTIDSLRAGNRMRRGG